ncbi:hypothetical protein B2J93_7257 [Marssonina coronariae]|uniref:J domain-containing protein n=1 Tax=Diplocarpon coronariae TaxID=2795749 RepID=A0A218Z836_9HELO|nr:hypothetical protein B2J93_7257 [Marssonina coronariae]
MASHTQVVLPLPILPQGWAADKDFKAVGSLSAATQRSIEPVGPHFLAHARRARHKRTFSEDDRIQAQENVKKVEDDDSGEISEAEDPSMLLRDAKDWKSQDHYAVLGLSKYRYKATEEQIKRAHRKKVLRHHPDKKAAAGSTEDDSFFKCIQKATEVLLDPVKRRQFDSVDEKADVEPPTKKQAAAGKYYKLWSNVFKAEGRFSKIQPVPKFGDEKSTKEDVEEFYNFFYNFDSWRSFEYQDEDVPDDNENRDQKRHMERKNNNARKKKKNEDVARLRQLVDVAMAGDVRIKQFRDAANASKNKKRLDKEAAEKKALEDARAAKEAEAKAAKEAEEKAKADRELGKKAKEAAKAAVKKNRRVLKGSVKDANYFVSGDAPASAIDAVLNDVELLQGKLDPDETAALAGKLNGLKIADEIKSVWSGESEADWGRSDELFADAGAFACGLILTHGSSGLSGENESNSTTQQGTRPSTWKRRCHSEVSECAGARTYSSPARHLLQPEPKETLPSNPPACSSSRRPRPQIVAATWVPADTPPPVPSSRDPAVAVAVAGSQLRRAVTSPPELARCRGSRARADRFGAQGKGKRGLPLSESRKVNKLDGGGECVPGASLPRPRRG